jgi:hypothetical protein
LQTSRLNKTIAWRRKARRTRCPRSLSSDTGGWTALVGNRGRWEGQSEFLFPVQWMMSIFANNLYRADIFQSFYTLYLHPYTCIYNQCVYLCLCMLGFEWFKLRKDGQHFPIAN